MGFSNKAGYGGTKYGETFWSTGAFQGGYNEGVHTASAPGEVTLLLQQWQAGNPTALNEAMQFVYAEMHRSAEWILRRGRQSITMQPTVLIHEVFLRLAGERVPPQIRDKRHFLAFTAKVMRRILVDGARQRNSVKRGGELHRITVSDQLESAGEDLDQFLMVDAALSNLFEANADLARVIELRYYGGYELQEVAEILEVSLATVVRRQRAAEAWLAREIAGRKH